jgi:transcriptional regulator with XRE-family HTH domain
MSQIIITIDVQDHKAVVTRIPLDWKHTFADRLKTARVKAGYSQKELATKLGIAQSSVSAWGSGDTYPTIEHVKAITEILDVTFDYLTDGMGGEK